MGDPPKKVVTRAVRAVCHPLVKTRYIALHDMNRNSQAVCTAFLERVAREMQTFRLWTPFDAGARHTEFMFIV